MSNPIEFSTDGKSEWDVFNEAAGKILSITRKAKAGKLQLMVRDEDDKPIGLLVCVTEDIPAYLEAIQKCEKELDANEEEES